MFTGKLAVSTRAYDATPTADPDRNAVLPTNEQLQNKHTNSLLLMRIYNLHKNSQTVKKGAAHAKKTA